MFIQEICRRTGLTKKAVEYYIQEGLVCPQTCENGYRQFTQQDADLLERIRILRQLGLSVAQLRQALPKPDGEYLRRLSIQNKLDAQDQETRLSILEELSRTADYEKAAQRLRTIAERATITQRLLQAFPGYYGRFICLHFARFLDEPVRTQQQQEAYRVILEFLDGLPELEMGPELMEYFTECTSQLGSRQMEESQQALRRAIEQPQEYVSENRDWIAQYLAFKESEEYRASPAYQLEKLFREFNAASGYNTVFLPAMRRLSPAYDAYCRQLERANELFLREYPQAK